MNLSDESLIWQKELADWTQLKDLTDDHYKIQNIFKDIKANIILKQME